MAIDDAQAIAAHARAVRLIFTRRYGAKLSYELELHGQQDGSPIELADLYAQLLSQAVKVDWPRTTYLADVDPGYYAANYLRAWALETHLRHSLQTRFGEEWFAQSQAGDFLKQIWREGQRLNADELVAQFTDTELDFSAMLADLELH
jgi:hypothetical protein